MNQYSTVDEYIAAYPEHIQGFLRTLRATIHQAAPEASEKISYGIPTFTLNGNLVHFGAFKDHIGFFPTSGGVAAFSKELAPYKTSKGTVQFPLHKPLPLVLIRKIVKFRVLQNQTKKNK